MTAAHSTFPRGKHPNSIASLSQRGRPPLPAGQAKEPHTLTFSDDGWKGISALAADHDRSVSSLVDFLGANHPLLQMPLGKLISTLAASGTPSSVMEMSVVELIYAAAAAQRSA